MSMIQFRFSPIYSEKNLREALLYIHMQSHIVCRKTLGKLLPVAGNIGVFCHYEDEYASLIEIRKNLTNSNNWNNKYFQLHNPIVFPNNAGFPETRYTYLYIRKPDERSTNVGDVDFYLNPHDYSQLKNEVLSGKYKNGVTLFERPDLDLIRLSDPKIDVSTFVGSYVLEKVAVTTQKT